jgi:hypothetical protein
LVHLLFQRLHVCLDCLDLLLDLLLDSDVVCLDLLLDSDVVCLDLLLDSDVVCLDLLLESGDLLLDYGNFLLDSVNLLRALFLEVCKHDAHDSLDVVDNTEIDVFSNIKSLVQWLCQDHQNHIWFIYSNQFFEESSYSEVFTIVLTHVTILAVLLIRNDLVVSLGNHSNQEVEKNNQVDKQVQKPLNPNASDHEVFLKRRRFL